MYSEDRSGVARRPAGVSGTDTLSRLTGLVTRGQPLFAERCRPPGAAVTDPI